MRFRRCGPHSQDQCPGRRATPMGRRYPLSRFRTYVTRELQARLPTRVPCLAPLFRPDQPGPWIAHIRELIRKTGWKTTPSQVLTIRAGSYSPPRGTGLFTCVLAVCSSSESTGLHEYGHQYQTARINMSNKQLSNICVPDMTTYDPM